MKLWKNLMVVAVALLLVSAILAAQYVSVQVDSTVVGIDTHEAGLQIGASDPSVNSTGLGDEDHNYILEYHSDVEGSEMFQINLGTWGAQNEFTTTAAFFIANANPEDVYITGATIEGAEDLGDYGLSMYLHNNSHEQDLTGEYVDITELATDNYVHLVGVEDAYTDADTVGSGELQIQIDDDEGPVTTNADLVESYDDDTDGIWHLDETTDIDGFVVDGTSDASACWVRVEVSPETGLEQGDLTITFQTQSSI